MIHAIARTRRPLRQSVGFDLPRGHPMTHVSSGRRVASPPRTLRSAQRRFHQLCQGATATSQRKGLQNDDETMRRLTRAAYRVVLCSSEIEFVVPAEELRFWPIVHWYPDILLSGHLQGKSRRTISSHGVMEHRLTEVQNDSTWFDWGL